MRQANLPEELDRFCLRLSGVTHPSKKNICMYTVGVCMHPSNHNSSATDRERISQREAKVSS